MKNTRLTSILSSGFIACALAIGSLASTQSASAQSRTTLAQVNIPFAFQTETRSLPAGTYRIVRDNGNTIHLIGSAHNSGFAMTHDAIKMHASDYGTIVFDRYGDKYFLHQIWTAGETTGLECAKGRAEKAVVVAQNEKAPTSVELALNTAPLK
jgi:hypothetical protein